MQQTIRAGARILALAFALALVAGSAPAATPASAAATAAASSSCRAVKPFYWEVGDRDKVLASGSVGSGAPARSTPVNIASASKWLYAAYVVERGLQSDERPFLNLTAGYTDFGVCRPRQTVAACDAAGTNAKRDPAAVGRFSYGGGHMQKLAADGELGKMTPAQLGAAISGTLGVKVAYQEAQLAGGATISAAEYAAFLRRLMLGQLKLGALLDDQPVCTDPGTCPTALRSPVPVRWGYTLGHWLESPDGDGAFSSPGAFGFYPWVSRGRDLYGIVARSGKPAAWAGAKCGASIRAAFVGAR